MNIALMNTRLTALVTVLAIVAAAALLVTPGGTAQVAASQNVDARIAGHVLKIKGTKDDDKLTLRLNAGDANVLEVDVGDDGTADFRFDRALFTKIKVNARDGNDLIRVDEANGPIVEPASFLGGNGNDTILGGSAIETINGGDGDDFIDGNRGNDVAFMGAGDDTFRWDPGDGSDVVEGQDGSDTLLFNGSNGGETVDLSANGDRFIFFRQPGSVTMDVNELETSVFNALGGPDTITVSDLTGTDVTRVDLNLDAGLGGGTGDGQPDQVTVDGTAGDDNIVIAGSAGSVEVTGLSATVAIRAAEAANDLLSVNALGGDDTVDASALQADAIKELTVDGGDGDDVIRGGRGGDSLTGGEGDDSIDGNQANDIAFMGAGDDTFVWDPGDGSDVVEGGEGSDTLLFNGANVSENVDLSANNKRFRFLRQPGNITMDVNEVETSVFNALGGADIVTVNDLTGIEPTQVNINLENPLGSGGGDGQTDQVIVNGTDGDDSVAVTGRGGSVSVTGLAAAVAISQADAPIDRLDVNTLAGKDTVDTSGLAPGVIQLFVDGVPVDDPPNTPSPAPTASPSPTPTGTISPTATDTPSPTAVAPTAVPTAAPAPPTAAVLAGPLSFPNAGGSAGSHGSGLALFLASVPIGIIVSAGGWVLGQAAARRRGPRS